MSRGDRFQLIPLSKRGYIWQLDHAHVRVDGSRVVYQRAEDSAFREYNIPYVNSSLLLLGEGTSITRDAVRLIANHGAIIGFTGGGGTPLLAASTPEFVVLEPQDEYRPTQYMQSWIRIFFDDQRRLNAAKHLLEKRLEFIHSAYETLDCCAQFGLYPEDLREPETAFRAVMASARNTTDLLAAEGRFAKDVYRLTGDAFDIPFKRTPRTSGDDTPSDQANKNLDHANYLAYGLAAVCLHGLGIPFGLPLLHGKTRRGALVFDIADLIKDGICVPLAFYCAAEQLSESEARACVLKAARDTDALEFMFDSVKDIAQACSP